MRGFKQAPAAQVVCAGHGFYRLGLVAGDPRIPRTATGGAWDELTAALQAA